MSSTEWSADLEIGIVWQDHQHQKFFRIRDLLKSSNAIADMKLFAQALMQLQHYVDDHFGTEEAYMDRTGYPAAEDHKKEHALFKKKLRRAKKEFLAYRRAQQEGDEAALNPWLDLSLDLELWFVEHIRGSDRELGAYLKEQRLL